MEITELQHTRLYHLQVSHLVGCAPARVCVCGGGTVTPWRSTPSEFFDKIDSTPIVGKIHVFGQNLL